MDNYEMLAKAAEAAGYYDYDPCTGELKVDKYAERIPNWNPWDDDAQAFRLMIDADITVCPDGEDTVSAGEAYLRITGAFVSEPVRGCKRAAVRHAIVKVAAEITDNLEACKQCLSRGRKTI